MNVINQPELEHWIETLMVRERQHVVRWLGTRFRKWLFKQKDQFAHITDVITGDTVVPMVEQYRRQPIPISKVVEHLRDHRYFYWKYEIDLVWFVEDQAEPGRVLQYQQPVVMASHWQWSLLAEGDFSLWMFNRRLADDVRHIIDWMNANPTVLPPDITRLSYEDALAKSNAWHTRQYRAYAEASTRHLQINANDPGNREKLPVVDGTAHLLHDKQALMYEHVKMHHCVHTYWPRVEAGDCLTVHLELPSEEVATLELRPKFGERGWRLGQLRGVCNRPVSASMESLAVRVEHTINANLKENNASTRNLQKGLDLLARASAGRTAGRTPVDSRGWQPAGGLHERIPGTVHVWRRAERSYLSSAAVASDGATHSPAG